MATGSGASLLEAIRFAVLDGSAFAVMIIFVRFVVPTAPIVETRAEVSHYIGDEAVLTWWPKHGLPDARCLQCVFRMKAVLNKRRDYYMKEYGLVPEFKASAHIGRVVATEVGQI